MKKSNIITGIKREEILNLVNTLVETNNIEWTRFDSKKAWFSNLLRTADGHEYRLLKSYETIVVLVDINNGKYYELGKWSSTTSKQVTQFFNEYYRNWERYLLA